MDRDVMPRPTRFAARRLALCGLCLAAGCELVTDFSPTERDDAGHDADPTDTAPGDAEMHCSELAAPCPPWMVYIPCGNSLMGSPDGAGTADERPEHIVKVSAFCIDRREATNGQYAECVRAGVCDPPYSPASATRGSYYSDPAYAAFPGLHIDWGMAAAFCAWVGKRLPTEAEWEKAARGGCEIAAPTTCGAEDERPYPWGDGTTTCDLANSAGCGGDTTAVDAHPSGASPYGLEDLAGNAAEGTADWYGEATYAECATGCTDPRGAAGGTTRSVRGGSWSDPIDGLRVADRSGQPPLFAGDTVGLRCAAPVP
jgi:formylglycine-generating enzyme required for sulfatase activity